MGLLERQREKGEEKRKMRDKTGTEFFYITICYYNLYYFNELYVKIEIEILGEL